MSGCAHPALTKVYDRLGMMREQPDGTVCAPVLEWHYACAGCGEAVYAERVGDPEEATREALTLALRKVATAIVVTSKYVQGRPLP
jgi:hypothetical protein